MWWPKNQTRCSCVPQEAGSTSFSEGTGHPSLVIKKKDPLCFFYIWQSQWMKSVILKSSGSSQHGTGLKYSAFCLQPPAKSDAMIRRPRDLRGTNMHKVAQQHLVRALHLTFMTSQRAHFQPPIFRQLLFLKKRQKKQRLDMCHLRGVDSPAAGTRFRTTMTRHVCRATRDLSADHHHQIHVSFCLFTEHTMECQYTNRVFTSSKVYTV